jgi:hypothetical protein
MNWPPEVFRDISARARPSKGAVIRPFTDERGLISEEPWGGPPELVYGSADRPQLSRPVWACQPTLPIAAVVGQQVK